jgi:hypothetical protein
MLSIQDRGAHTLAPPIACTFRQTQEGKTMETMFYVAGAFFFVFAGAMLAGIHDSLSKIAKHLTEPKEAE